jgi:kynurenine 3-monooxygenase
MPNIKNHIAVVGAGLVGSLLSIYLAKRGYRVSLLERRADMRKQTVGGGRSINLALSSRGIKALNDVGLAEKIEGSAIPMRGRMVHGLFGHPNFQAYGKEGQFINSISRSGLNMTLMDEAERCGVDIEFNCRVEAVDLVKTLLVKSGQSAVSSGQGTGAESQEYKLIIGADGAYSSVRNAFQISDRFDYSQTYIEHGYKELTIPAGNGNAFRMEKNALHIWPRESFMLIALPNPDGSFTCTMFFPIDGTLSFQAIKSENDVRAFFEKYFPDVVPLMPTLAEDFLSNPVSSLVTIRCWPWAKNNALLIGDAAHGIVPFFGQGMNAGFEDCRILNELLDQHHDNWKKVLAEFQYVRKPDTDAIAELALYNFIEMRDLVADPDFILRKRIEAKLHELFPDKWIPLYSMVTFNENIRYSEALAIGKKQKEIMDEVMNRVGIEKNWEAVDFGSLILRLQ